jgi:hypothetical protein
VVPSASTVDSLLKKAIDGRAGTVMPFATVLKRPAEVIGSTRFWKIDRSTASWRSAAPGSQGVVAEIFRQHRSQVPDAASRLRGVAMRARAVHHRRDQRRNHATAILRLGAQQEGIVRHERIMPDGRKRNSVRFSIIDDEWPQVRLHLEQKLDV